MMQPIVLKYGEELGRGIEQAGSAFAEAIKESRKRKALSPFEQTMKDAQNPDTPRLSVSEAYNQAIQQGADPQEASSMAQMYMYQQEQDAFKQGFDASSQFEGGIYSQQGRNAFLQTFSKAGGNLKSVVKMLEMPKKGAQTFLDKKFDAAKAEAVLEVVKGGGKAKEIYDSLQWLEQNKNKVGKARGYLNRGPMQSETYAEFENRGNLILSPVITLFNKAGTLPTRKLEWIRDQFAISPYQTQAQIQGRLNAIKPLTQAAMDYQAKISDLINKYGARDIPDDEFLKVTTKLNNDVDAVYNQQFEQKTFDKVPDARKMAGKTITNPETGEKLISNGKTWIKTSGGK